MSWRHLKKFRCVNTRLGSENPPIETELFDYGMVNMLEQYCLCKFTEVELKEITPTYWEVSYNFKALPGPHQYKLVIEQLSEEPPESEFPAPKPPRFK
jgi:hypothetical protein